MQPVKQLSSNIIRILGMNPGPMTLQGTNTYLIGKNKGRILIDSGQNMPEYKTILENVLKETGSYIDQLLITHCHHDHVKGITQILDLCNQNVKIQKYKRMPQDEILEKKYNFKYNYLKENEVINGNEIQIQCLPMTGHLPDHCCYYLQEDKALFTGDFILSGSSSVVRDLKAQFENYETALKLEAEMLLSAHGPEIIGIEKVREDIMNNYNHRLLREKQIIQTLKEASDLYISPQDILSKVYPDLKSEKLILGALNNIEVHLKKLIGEEKVLSQQINEKEQIYKLQI